MEKLKIFFTTLSAQLSKFWSELNSTKKIMVGGVVALLSVGLVAIFALRPQEQMEYLVVDTGPDDVSAIVGFLKKNGVTDYVVDDKGIKVAPGKSTELRIKLTQEGLPSHGQVGWEKFDSQDFTRTEFEQKINKLRAIQGELGRTIANIEGVASARVHIVKPDSSLFVEDKKEPTAAVYIKAKRGVTLDNRQIKGIVHLVSRSVEGLRPENISIIDGDGKMLTEERSEDPTANQTKEMLEFRRNIERELEARVRGIVGKVVGPDRVDAKIDATVDYTKEEQTISDIDPEKVAVVSSNTTNQDMSGSGLNPTGIPGSKSNVPGEQEELSVGTSQAKNTRASERFNYEIAKSVSHKVLPVGTITRISAAVLVDGKQIYPSDGSAPVFEARTEEEMKKIEELVKNAIGFKDGRDSVKVHNMLFQLDPLQIQQITEDKKENREYLSTLAISGVVALSLVFFFAFIVRPYFRWLSYDPERQASEATVEEFTPDLELGSIQNVQIKEDVPFEKLTPQEQVMYIAKHEPMRTTEALRMLLNPHANNNGP